MTTQRSLDDYVSKVLRKLSPCAGILSEASTKTVSSISSTRYTMEKDLENMSGHANLLSDERPHHMFEPYSNEDNVVHLVEQILK